MNRRSFWVAVGVLALVVLGASWIFEHFDRVPATRWERPGREAAMNPYLALERFMARMGLPVSRIDSVRGLEQLPPGGVLLLDRGRRQPVDPRRAEALLRWVREGGYLVVAAEAKGVDDPILTRLGVTWAESVPAPDKAAPATPAPETVAVRLPGRERPLELHNHHRYGNLGLLATEPAPVWRAGVEEARSALLHYAYGRGAVTVVEGFKFLTNAHIGEYDHAELIWSLVQEYRPGSEIRLASGLAVPSLWRWLEQSAWMALVSGAVLVAAWLWAIIPRFGGVLPGEEPVRRSLREHLAAVGCAVWREGGLGVWQELLRRDLASRIAVHHPHLAALPAAERAATLARAGEVAPERVADLLEGSSAPAPEEFTARVRTLQQLEQRL